MACSKDFRIRVVEYILSGNTWFVKMLLPALPGGNTIIVLVSTYCYTFVKTGFYIILQLFFISLSIISKHKIKLM